MKFEPIRILVVEPNLLVRKGLVSILDSEDDLNVVGEACNAQEALLQIKEKDIDVVLTELWVQDETRSLVATIGKEYPGKPKIVVLTASGEAKHLFDAMRLGAQGYLLKSLDPGIWMEVIRSVVSENKSLASNIACEILRQFAEQLGQEKNEKVNLLSNREKEILHSVALGLTNGEIGEKLNISANTVKNHLQRIGQKLGTDNKAQLISFAIRHGFSVKENK